MRLLGRSHAFSYQRSILMQRKAHLPAVDHLPRTYPCCLVSP
ncbi:hypothetical protein D779_0774 [Imhoffiella purpurea]|uniref:Uncharacterized protein n=1 Tax=Imhoffiella purpurea TaxID=1249627 RepID=W9VZX4_9GAMM|nr:hypothetical protein D779_0774 [Imhoffiella purpurea]